MIQYLFLSRNKIKINKKVLIKRVHLSEIVQYYTENTYLGNKKLFLITVFQNIEKKNVFRRIRAVFLINYRC